MDDILSVLFDSKQAPHFYIRETEIAYQPLKKHLSGGEGILLFLLMKIQKTSVLQPAQNQACLWRFTVGARNV